MVPLQIIVYRLHSWIPAFIFISVNDAAADDDDDILSEKF
jgi:hypothetical protein